MDSIEPSALGVVIPSHGRTDLVQRLLESLESERKCFAESCDAVIVDDSSSDESRRIAEFCARYDVRYIFSPGNVSQKRNLGARFVRGDIILFLDSDCEARPGLLIAHMLAYIRNRAIACLGLVTFVGQNNWLIDTIEESPLLAPFSSPLERQIVTWGPSANFSVLRQAFEQVGGFDETRSPPGTGGEDVDLGLRLSSEVGNIVTAPDAEVWHSKSTWSGLRDNIRRFLAWGRGDCLLIRKHPRLSFWDMPSLLAISVFVIIVTLWLAIVQQRLWSLLAMPLFPIIASLLFGLFHPLKKAALKRRICRGGSLLLMTVLDIGRLLEAFKLRRPWMALRRFRFEQDQIQHEWDDLVLTSWALILAVCVIGIVFW